ncbi:MAG: tetratricopeptide repeat protein [Alphaproteobacteria bacterium]|nr:tetratricopeptide repeat protein [Alphaproteobacteria bacterium]
MLAIAALLAVAAPAPASADQADPRLDDLFRTLQGGELSFGEARGIETRIWGIWLETESAAAEVLLRDGMDAMRDFDLDRAEESFSALVALSPDFAEGWNKRATIRYHVGDYQGSIADIKRTLSLEPRHFGAMAGLGLVYDALGEPEPAVEAFERALELNPYMPGIAQRLDRMKQQLEDRRI